MPPAGADEDGCTIEWDIDTETDRLKRSDTRRTEPIRGPAQHLPSGCGQIVRWGCAMD
jgi:hypothetical protein